jgi:hypothetical protein
MTTDQELDARIEELVRAVAEAAPPAPSLTRVFAEQRPSAPLGELHPSSPTAYPLGSAEPAGHRRTAVLVALAVLALGVIVGVVIVASRSDQTAPYVGPPSSTVAPTGAEVDPRRQPYVGLTRDAQTGIGFTFDVEEQVVRPIPFPESASRTFSTGTWTGTVVIVCCGADAASGVPDPAPAAAAWNPTTGTWRALASPPADVAGTRTRAAWTGEQLVVVTETGEAAVYDPADDAWVGLVPLPLTIDRTVLSTRRVDVLWTGSTVVAWAAEFVGCLCPDAPEIDRGFVLRADRSGWEALPPLPPEARTQLGQAAWSGSHVVVWGDSVGSPGTGVGATWEPGHPEWAVLPAWPLGPVDWFDGTSGSQTVAADPGSGRVLVTGLDGGGPRETFTIRPGDAQWTPAGITVGGYSPPFEVLDGWVLAPNPANPVVGRLP